MSTHRFSLRTDKPDKVGKCPIELIYQISGQRKKTFLGYKLHPINWDIKDQGACYIPADEAIKLLSQGSDQKLSSRKLDAIILSDIEVKEINKEIALIEYVITKIEEDFQEAKHVYSAEDVITKFKLRKTNETKKSEPSDHRDFLFDFMDRYINDHTAIRANGSLTVYKSVKRHLWNFQQVHQERVKFNSIDHGFFKRFQNYLITESKLNNTTIAKVLSTLKTFLNYALENGIVVNDSYKRFKIKREKLEVIALTNDEFNRVLNKDFSNNKRLDKVRDIFVFSCVTGLRVSDLLQLKREHIRNDEITIVVKKTKSELVIPLNKISSAILDKYKCLIRPLPSISSPKLNEYIKEVCEEAEIIDPIEIVRFRGPKREATVYPKYKLIHIHTGRKTFVTLSLEKGMSAEQVMAITGHTDYQSFKRYVNISRKLTKVVMTKTWGEVPILKVV